MKLSITKYKDESWRDFTRYILSHLKRIKKAKNITVDITYDYKKEVKKHPLEVLSN